MQARRDDPKDIKLDANAALAETERDLRGNDVSSRDDKLIATAPDGSTLMQYATDRTRFKGNLLDADGEYVSVRTFIADTTDDAISIWNDWRRMKKDELEAEAAKNKPAEAPEIPKEAPTVSATAERQGDGPTGKADEAGMPENGAGSGTVATQDPFEPTARDAVAQGKSASLAPSPFDKAKTSFTEEERETVVKYLLERVQEGARLADVANELNINPKTLSNWKNKYLKSAKTEEESLMSRNNAPKADEGKATNNADKTAAAIKDEGEPCLVMYANKEYYGHFRSRRRAEQWCKTANEALAFLRKQGVLEGTGTFNVQEIEWRG